MSIRHERVGKVIYEESCKMKLKFAHTTKCYTHKPESVQENNTHKIHRDFEVQTDHLVLARRPNRVIINKNNNKKKGKFYRTGRPQEKIKENEKRDEYLNLAGELKTLLSMKVTVIPTVK